MEETVMVLVQKYQFISVALMVIGVLRVVNKPLFAFLRVLVSATPTAKDDVVLKQVEGSKAYRWVSFVLDWFASIKLPQK